MDIDEIKLYTHKTKEIKVINKNKHSLYKYVVLKINGDKWMIRDDETIRFSLSPTDDFIDHQQIEKDYYCYIPNILNNEFLIYVHFFPSDLYIYEMLDDLVSEYDFETLMNDAIIESEYYEQEFDESGRLIIQSTDSNSINNVHDPNYKNYTNVNPNINKTGQGFFPLSSRYRTYQNWQVPNITNPSPEWNITNNKNPFWQARIPFNDLKTPTNVFINYEYLPTSREYHQHYFGFEPKDMTILNNDCKTLNVFEGTNINLLDDKFGNKNNYRIINLGNPYDDTYSMFVEHGQTIPVDFDNLIQYNKNTQMCRWKKHKCKNYYIYTPINNDDNPHYCYREVSLEKDSYYSLLYYIYIPSQTNIKNEEGYIDVEVDNVSHKIDEGFLFKDKQLRDQWIYHEVPFIAGDKNIIKIFGPQKYDEDSDYPNSIYFHYLELKKIEQYSPTLKYTDVGLNVTEQNQKIFRPLDNKPCTKVSINPDNKTYEPSIKDFGTPHSNVNIVSKDEKYVYYDKYTSDLIYVTDSDDGAIDYIEETSDLIFPGNEDINFYINDYSLYCDSNRKITGVYGPDNIFFFDFVDENDNFIKEGEVEVSILTQRDKNIDNKGLRVTRSFVPVTGSMVFNNVDLTSLKQDNDTDEYFIRLYYTSKCLDEPIIVFKNLYMYDEEISINKIKINDTEYNVEEITEYVIDDVHDFPLKIEVQSINQNNGIQTKGYYELSINDELNQSTLVDNGWGDFYLRQDDLQVGTQTIKISYYRKNYSSLAFVYFDIKVDNLKNLQDYVPIDLKIFKDGFTQALPLNDTIEVESDDCALSVIETKNHSKFRIEVYRNDKLIIKKNIYNPVASDINFIHATWDEWQEHDQYTFKIVTGNMYDDSGNIIKDLYRDYERTFVIKKPKPI